MLLLRTPYRPDHLKFDADGKALGNPEVGTWAMDSAILIQKVRLKPGKLEFEAIREVQAYVNGALRAAAAPDKLRLRLKLNPLLPDAGMIERLKNAFLDSGESKQQPAPPPDLDHFENDRWERRAGPPEMYRLKGDPEWLLPKNIHEAIQAGALEDGERIYVVTAALRPPKAVTMRDPEYSAEARRRKLQGDSMVRAVVDQRGLVHSAALVKSTPGFEVSALGMLRDWRFQPATINGQPVAVVIDIQTSFRLY